MDPKQLRTVSQLLSGTTGLNQLRNLDLHTMCADPMPTIAAGRKKPRLLNAISVEHEALDAVNAAA